MYLNSIYKMQKPQHKVTVSRSVIETTEGMIYIVTYQFALCNLCLLNRVYIIASKEGLDRYTVSRPLWFFYILRMLKNITKLFDLHFGSHPKAHSRMCNYAHPLAIMKNTQTLSVCFPCSGQGGTRTLNP